METEWIIMMIMVVVVCRRSALIKRRVHRSPLNVCCWHQSRRPVVFYGSSYKTPTGLYRWHCPATDDIPATAREPTQTGARWVCTRPSLTLSASTFNHRLTLLPAHLVSTSTISTSSNIKVTASATIYWFVIIHNSPTYHREWPSEQIEFCE